MLSGKKIFAIFCVLGVLAMAWYKFRSPEVESKNAVTTVTLAPTSLTAEPVQPQSSTQSTPTVRPHEAIVEPPLWRIDENTVNTIQSKDEIFSFLKSAVIPNFSNVLKSAKHLDQIEMSLNGCFVGKLNEYEIKIFSDIHHGTDPLRGVVVTELIENGKSFGELKWQGVLGNLVTLNPSSKSVVLELQKKPAAYLHLFYFPQINVFSGNLYIGSDQEHLMHIGPIRLVPASMCND